MFHTICKYILSTCHARMLRGEIRNLNFMGIRGLVRKIQSVESAKGILLEEIPPKSTLLIDGYGWMFTLIKELDETYPNRELGGSYFSIDLLVAKHATRLMNDLNFKVIVFIDGDLTRLKDLTIEKRTRRKEEMWTNLQDFCYTHATHNQDNYPITSLTVAQFERSVRNAGLQLVHCAEEADQEMARKCLTMNSNGDHAFCLSSDRYDKDMYTYLQISNKNCRAFQ